MGLADGERERAAFIGNSDAIGDSFVERFEALLHRRTRHVDFVAFAGIELPQPLDPASSTARLRADFAGDFRATAFVLDRHQSRSGRRPGDVVSSDSRNDSTVAGMLRETISLNVALILADAKSANNEPTTVIPAASPKAK